MNYKHKSDQPTLNDAELQVLERLRQQLKGALQAAGVDLPDNPSVGH